MGQQGQNDPRSGLEGRRVYDIVGVGFGPANLALAAVIEEEADRLGSRPVDSLFLEAKPRYVWHPGMLIGGALVQLSFLKDLATLRNPQSRFTFLNYLRHKGRLDKFINLRNFYPTRLEYNDYFCWVAEQVADQVRYGRRVVSVTPIAAGDRVELLKVIVRNLQSGAEEEYTARNLVVATGGVPQVPAGCDVPLGERIFHSQDFLDRIAGFGDPQGKYRFLVVGSGQSAAEIFHYLMCHYPGSEVTATLRRYAYKPADNSDFVNEIFFPDMVGFLYGLPEHKRRSIVRQHEDTNYSAVDLDLIQDIYRELYRKLVAGEDNFKIKPFMELRGMREGDNGVIAEFFNSAVDRPELLEADAVILATGYRREKRHPLLRDLEPYFTTDGASYKVARDYHVIAKPGFAPEVFLQGFCEDTHGLSDTLLSVLPLRSAEILEAVVCARAEAEQELDRAHAV